MTDETEKKRAEGCARSNLSEIVRLVGAYEEAQEGEIECGECNGTGIISGGKTGDGDDEPCPVCDGSGTIPSEVDEDEIREEIDNFPLSLSVRDSWYAPGAKQDAEPMEYEILLSTGGPACRIYGNLDEHNEPDDFPDIQFQDWFTPWESLDIESEEREALAKFARFFWFGE